MFVRKKKNKSGVVSIQVIIKIGGKSRLVKTIGSSADKFEIDTLYKKAKRFIKEYEGQQTLDFNNSQEYFLSAFKSITSHTEVGTEYLLGKIFDDIGFNQINDILFRYLVFARLNYPVSKLKTKDYLYRYKAIEISSQQIYRYLDKLHSTPERVGTADQLCAYPENPQQQY